MARLPDDTAFGTLASAQSNRPIATYDVTGYAKGAAAIAQGTKDLGAGIAGAGADIGAIARQRRSEEETLDNAKAESTYLVRTKQIQDQLEAETEPGDLRKKYEPLFQKARDDAAALIPDARRRELFLLRRNPDVEALSIRADGVNTKLRNDRDYSDAEKDLGSLAQSAVAERDEFRRGEYVRAGSDLIDGLVGRGILTNQQALARKQKWVKDFTAADAMARIDRGEGEQLLQELRESRDFLPKPAERVAPASGPAAAIGKVSENLGIEPSVLSRVISYETGGTFSPSKWGGKGGNYLGLIQFSPENQKLYGVRPGQSFEEQMGAVEAYLKDRGVKPGMGTAEIYSIINAGSLDAKGQPRWDAFDGNGTLREHVAKIDRDHAAAGDRFLGLEPGTVRLAQAPGATATDGAATPVPRAPNKYDLLDPLQRETLITRAEASLRKKAVADDAVFKARVQDTTTEAFTTGVAKNPVPREEFVARLGPEAGAQAFEQYSRDLQLGSDRQRVATMTPTEQEDLHKSYMPAAGSSNYVAQLKRAGVLSQAISDVDKEKKADPAMFAIERLPAAREGWDNLQSTLQDPTKGFEERRAAARDFALRMDTEQARVGISADQRRIVPAGYVDALVRNLEKPASADGKATPLDAARILQSEAQLWGDAWPMVSRDVQGKATAPIVRVLAAGVTDQAGMVLPGLMHVSLSDILKGHGEEKIDEIKKQAELQVKTFAATMLGTREQVEFFRDYLDANQKLAAHYVMNGKTASDAALLAFKDTLGHKYDFVQGGLFGPWSSPYGVVRVPKDAGVPLDKITLGARAARDQLGELGLAPAVSGDKSVSPEYLQQAAVSGLRRDGVWATAPGDTGLVLVHNGKVATKADGSPLLLTWKQLGDLGDASKAADTKRDSKFLEFTGMPRG